MKISYKPVSGGRYVVLMDDAAGDTNVEFKPVASNKNQATPLASTGGPGSQFTKFLGNTLESLSFTINKAYSSASAGLAASRTMVSAFAAQVHIQVIQDMETQYYPNATLESLAREIQGQTVTYSFQFRSQAVQATAP